MTSRSCQRKGKRGEIEVAELLSRLFGVDVRRGASPYLPGLLAPDVLGLPGVHIEVKRVQKLNLPAALRQARQDANGDTAVVIHRRNRAGWVASTLLDDLPTLSRRLAAITGHEDGQQGG